MRRVYNNYASMVGNTNLVRLNGPSKLTGCEIYGKCEFQNPGGSVKDRAGLGIILDAEKRNILVRGKKGLIIEGTAGNTGIGLCLAGNSFGYDTIICIAESQSIEKKNTLRQLGAKLIEVPAVPYKDPNNYVHVAERLSEQLRSLETEYGSHILYANQWDNLANSQIHYNTTAPEIWEQTNGKIDAFNCAVGTGGSIHGIGSFLKEKNPNIQIALTDPCGAALYRYFLNGELKAVGSSITEGIGQGRITKNLGNFKPDQVHEILDEEALPILYKLLSEEGLYLGSSSAINVAGAIAVAKELGPNHTIVTLLCDSASRYESKLFNVPFLMGRGLPFPEWLSSSSDQETNDLKNIVEQNILIK